MPGVFAPEKAEAFVGGLVEGREEVYFFLRVAGGERAQD